MSSSSSALEFQRRVAEWHRAGDTERLNMVDLYDEAFRYRETDPEYRFELFTRGRTEALRLNEPWWVLFFDSNRLSTATADLHDFARSLPLAMELLVRFNSPEGQAHPERIMILTNVLYTYLQVDPFGYRDDLERGFAYQNEQIAQGPVTERFVLDYRRTEYLCQTDRWEEAHELAHRSLSLVDRSGNRSHQLWHGAWSLFLLCEICAARGHLDELAGHAEDMARRSEKNGQLLRTQASASIWLAVAQRAAGDKRSAASSFHQGMNWLKSLDARDEICANQTARYYELDGDWKAAIGVRDRELAVVAKKGMLHRTCRVEIERCRLWSLAGSLNHEDILRAKQAASKLRAPETMLEKLANIGKV